MPISGIGSRWGTPFIHPPPLHTPTTPWIGPSPRNSVSTYEPGASLPKRPVAGDQDRSPSPARSSRGSTRRVLDHQSYPHILEQILRESTWDVLNVFRASCKKYRDKIHEMHTRQLIFFLASSPPHAIRCPLGPIPSLRILHNHDFGHTQPAISNVLSHTRVIDVIGCPREHEHSACAFSLAFQKRDVVIRFHPTNHLHDVEEPVSARKVVMFGTSIRSCWKTLPPPHWAQEKTVLNLRSLNNPNELVSAFRRFPPSTGRREAVVVFTHWGADMGYQVPVALDHVVSPWRLARERLTALVDLAAGMVTGGWLFPDMPSVNFTIVDFDQVSAHQFTLDPDTEKDEEPPPIVDGLLERIRTGIEEIVDKKSPPSKPLAERKALANAAFGRLHIVSLDEYATRVNDDEQVELDTVQLRYSNNA